MMVVGVVLAGEKNFATNPHAEELKGGAIALRKRKKAPPAGSASTLHSGKSMARKRFSLSHGQ
jgi:hypothetical protein